MGARRRSTMQASFDFEMLATAAAEQAARIIQATQPIYLAPAPVAPAAPAGFEPSTYQAAIFDFVSNGRGDGLVNAVAGSGKSTTLVHAARLVRGAGLFLAFNKHIAEELGAKLAGSTMTAKTIHAVGYKALADSKQLPGRPILEDRKVGQIVKELLAEVMPVYGDDEEARDERNRTAAGLRELADKARVTLTNAADLDAVAACVEKYGIDLDPDHFPLLACVLRRCEAVAKDAGVIDFTDMIWLPERWQLQPRRFEWVFVDECQDLSAAALALVLKLRAPGGRMLFVGDERQAIMGFAGADADSFWNIQRATEATLLPLSICYRCPTSHLDMARLIVPHIEARQTAPVGTVATIKEEQAIEQMAEGDLVLCRLTAPLISLCMQLIAKKIPARVRGRDIGRQLTNMAREVAKLSGFQYDEFPKHLDAYKAREMARLSRRNAGEAQFNSLDDRCAGLLACYDGIDAPTLAEMCASIESLFSDERASVWLSTVHRAKGLEEKRVFILRPDKLPLAHPKQSEWEATQELNLKYVALTRATESLTFIIPPPRS